jgi:hypothetical protein
MYDYVVCIEDGKCYENAAGQLTDIGAFCSYYALNQSLRLLLYSAVFVNTYVTTYCTLVQNVLPLYPVTDAARLLMLGLVD